MVCCLNPLFVSSNTTIDAYSGFFSVHMVTDVAMEGGGTLIFVYVDDLNTLCKFKGLPKIFFKLLQTKWLTELAWFSGV